MEWRSVTWNSLTFDGERHVIFLRVPGPGAPVVVARLLEGLADHEFAIPGHVVADITARGPATFADDGSATLELEALTVAD